MLEDSEIGSHGAGMISRREMFVEAAPAIRRVFEQARSATVWALPALSRR